MKKIQKRLLQIIMVAFLACVFTFVGKTNTYAIDYDGINDTSALPQPEGAYLSSPSSSSSYVYVYWNSSAEWTKSVDGVYVILNYYDSSDNYLGTSSSYTSSASSNSSCSVYKSSSYSSAAKYMAIIRTYKIVNSGTHYQTSTPIYSTVGHVKGSAPETKPTIAALSNITYSYNDGYAKVYATKPAFTSIPGVKESSYRIFLTGTNTTKKNVLFANSYSNSSYSTIDLDYNFGVKYTLKACAAAWNAELGVWYKGPASTITFQVPPRVKDFTQSVSSNTTSNTIKWTKSSIACDGYHVYKTSMDGDDAVTRIATLKSDARSYVDKSVKTNVPYAYIVLPYNKAWGDFLTPIGYLPANKNFTDASYIEDYDMVHQEKLFASSAGYCVPKTSISSLTQSAAGKKLTWKKVDGVSGYVIYCKAKSDSSYKAIKTIHGASTVTYTDARTLKAGTEYLYTVRPYYSVIGDCIKNFYATSCAAKTIKAGKYAPAAPALSSVTNSATGAKLTWSKAKNAVGYTIYRKVGSGKYAKLATVSGATTTYTDTTVKNGTTYSYYLVARSVSGTATGKAKSIYRLNAVAKAIISESTTNSLTVEWSRNNYVTAYEIAVTDNGVTTSYVVTGKDSFTYTAAGLTSGTTATVKVRSYRLVNDKKVYSAWCTATR